MSSTKNNRFLKSLLTANLGCGCGRPKLSEVYEPTPKPKIKIPKNPTDHQTPSSSSSCDKNGQSFTVDDDEEDEDQCMTSTTISFNNDSSEPESTNPKNTELLPSPTTDTRTKINDSIAVVKESNDPYQDFRQSMLQMIVEKKIYSKEDLQELLSCFLELNSASHHDVIIQAFTQIWNDLITESKKPIM